MAEKLNAFGDPIDSGPVNAFGDPVDAQPPAKNERTFFGELGRQIGLTARAVARGATLIPDVLIGAPLTAAANLGQAGIEAVTGRKMPRYSAPSIGGSIADAIRLPEAETPTERVVQDVGIGMTGAGAMIKGAQLAGQGATGAVKGVMDIMTQTPGLQIAAGGTGSGSAGIVREMGGGPGAQTAAGIVGGAVPFAGIGFAGTVRGAIRPDRAGFNDTVNLYERTIGVTPSVGQATGNLMTEGLESGLSRFPGGNVPMIGLATKEQLALGGKVESMASSVAPKGTKMSVGKLIEEGVIGPGGYMDQVKNAGKIIYDNLDSKFGSPDYPIPVTNTVSYLTSLAKGKPGAENILKVLQNAKVIDIGAQLNKDLAGSPGRQITLLGADAQPLSTVVIGGTPAKTTMRFDAWKDVRSRVGELLGDPQITSEIPRRQLKALYASMSSDVREAAKARDAQLVSAGSIPAGSQPTLQAVNGANKSMAFVHNRIDDILRPVMDAGGPEAIYNAALSRTKDGDTILNNIMRALPKEGKNALVADVFRRLGKSTGQNQNVEGTAFSTERFLTQWSNLSPEAKRTLTIALPRSFKEDLDNIVKVAANLREGSSVFKNPSGTGQAMMAAQSAGALAASIFMAPFVGIGPLAAAVGSIASTYGAARLVTSPAFVHWLAQATRVPMGAIPAQLNVLSNIASKEQDQDTKLAMQQYISDLGR